MHIQSGVNRIHTRNEQSINLNHAVFLDCTFRLGVPKPCFLHCNARSKTGPGAQCMGDSAHAQLSFPRIWGIRSP